MRLLSGLALGGSLLLVPACSDDTTIKSGPDRNTCEAGRETCACYGNGTCNGGLSCVSGRCQRAAGTGGGSGTGGGAGTGGFGTGGSSGAGAAGGSGGAGGGPVTAESMCRHFAIDCGIQTYEQCLADASQLSPEQIACIQESTCAALSQGRTDCESGTGGAGGSSGGAGTGGSGGSTGGSGGSTGGTGGGSGGSGGSTGGSGGSTGGTGGSGGSSGGTGGSGGGTTPCGTGIRTGTTPCTASCTGNVCGLADLGRRDCLCVESLYQCNPCAFPGNEPILQPPATPPSDCGDDEARRGSACSAGEQAVMCQPNDQNRICVCWNLEWDCDRKPWL